MKPPVNLQAVADLHEEAADGRLDSPLTGFAWVGTRTLFGLLENA